MKFRFSNHVKQEMVRRRIPEQFVVSVLNSPEQIISGKGDSKIYQSRIDFEGEKAYLLRVIVDDSVDPAVVITVYRTTKMSKYWRET